MRYLQKCNKKQLVNWLKNNIDKDFIHCICECSKNLLKGKVPITSSQKKNLAKRKNSLRLLTLKKTPLKKKKRIIQTGGFLGALLAPIVSALGGLFGGLMGR